jgi:hypothetical protein
MYPPYAPPLARGLSVDLRQAMGEVLRAAWLELDGVGAEAPIERTLVTAGRDQPGSCRTEIATDDERITFDVPLLRVGRNGFRVRGLLEREGNVREVTSAPQTVEYAVPEGLGLLGPGVFRLPPRDFPMYARDCPYGFCTDADGDGLNDLWESVASSELRPVLHLDAGDTLFDPSARRDTVRMLASVLPRKTKHGEFLLFSYIVLFSRDYGFLGLGFDHPGDTEAFAMLFRVERDHTLRWVRSVARGHPCLTCRPHYAWNEQEFAPSGAPALYVEQDKHGLWPNARACSARAAFYCRGQRTMRPASFNVGDFRRDGPRALVDRLDGNAFDGPFAELARSFPGEAIWTPSQARIPGRFCGGLTRDCSPTHSANLPGTVFASLYDAVERAGF